MTLHAGEMLFTTGEPFKEALYILSAGKIELQRLGQPAAIVEPGYILGIANYVDSTPYLSTAIALSKVILHILPAEKLRQAEHRYPEIVNAFNRLLTERIRSQATPPVKGVWALPARAIVQAPLATCNPATTIQEAFAIMNQRRIGSLGVINETGRLLGLITFVTLAHGLITKSARPVDKVVNTVSAAPHCIRSDAPLWEVQREQARLGAKYLVVTEKEKAVGIISQTDVLYTLVSYQQFPVIR
jgi:signal-transduction protein with cAMP-binding, CBS, and nucleotidyltransferase domain